MSDEEAPTYQMSGEFVVMPEQARVKFPCGLVVLFPKELSPLPAEHAQYLLRILALEIKSLPLP